MHPPVLHACIRTAAHDSSHSAQQHGLVLEKDRHATNKQNMHARIGHNMPASTIDTTCMPPFTQHAFLVVSSFGSLGAAAGLNLSRTRNTSL